jgi:ubiquinone/menaquinone biosynthesis C-methylase UbiE
MHRLAQKRVKKTGIKVEQGILSSEQLPFDDGTFDCAAGTFTLCGVEDVGKGLGEVFRV